MDELKAYFNVSTMASAKTIADAMIDAVFSSIPSGWRARVLEADIALDAIASGEGEEGTKTYAIRTVSHAYSATTVNTTMKNNFDSILTEWEDVITDSEMYDSVDSVEGDITIRSDDVAAITFTKTWGDNSTDDYSGRLKDCLMYKAVPTGQYDTVYIAVGCGNHVAKVNRTVMRSAIKSDLEALGAVSITSATLYLYGYSYSGAHTVSAYRVFLDWGEDTVTWNNATGVLAWNTAGCEAADDGGVEDSIYDRRATAESSDTSFAVGSYSTSLDLTSLAQEWLAGTASEYGVLLQSDNEAVNNWIRWNQKEDADGKRPYLKIIYTT